VATEERTEAIMTPAGTINLKHWLKILSERMRPPKKKAPAPPSPLGKKAGRIFLLKDKIFVKKRVSALSPKNILAFFARLASLIGKIVSGLLSRQKIATDDFASASPEKATKNKFWLSGRLAQVFLIVAVLSIAGLAINVSISKKRQEVATKTAAFAALLESIDKNQNKIESFLIYGNESEAKQIWDENKDLLAKLTEEEKKGRSDIATLFERQTKQLERLRKINMVLEQKKIADFSNLNKDASPENLILSGDRIYAASPKEKAVYKVDLKENMVTAAYNLGDIGEMNYPSTLDDGIFYLDKDAAIIIDKNDKAERIVVEGLPEKIGGAGIYNNRLYVVDKGNGQVRRYNRTEKGFSEQSEWLLAKTDLSSAVNVFIDGNIYILKSNGQAEKYLRGAKEEFSIKEVDEPISEATRLQIGEKHVYVIEPAKKRLVVFDEKGLLVGQYIFTSLESIKDVYVAEKTSQAYILSGQAIYQASIQQ
jgi:hypothetical protein